MYVVVLFLLLYLNMNVLVNIVNKRVEILYD